MVHTRGYMNLCNITSIQLTSQQLVIMVQVGHRLTPLLTLTLTLTPAQTLGPDDPGPRAFSHAPPSEATPLVTSLVRCERSERTGQPDGLPPV